MLSGELDLATPPHFNAKAAKTLPNSHRVIPRNTLSPIPRAQTAHLIFSWSEHGKSIDGRLRKILGNVRTNLSVQAAPISIIMDASYMEGVV
jgi:hypothetical protein